MKPFKIKTESEGHSKEIQEWLFSKGVHWWPKSLSGVLEGCKELYYGAIGDYISGSTGDSEYFEEHPLPEKWFYDGQLQDNPPVISLTYRQLIEAQLRGEVVQFRSSDGWVDLVSTINKPIYALDSLAKNMRIKPKPRFCNGVELDECIKEPLENGDVYHIANPLGNGYSSALFWRGGDNDFKYKIRGIAYLREESAIKHAKAMLNILY